MYNKLTNGAIKFSMATGVSTFSLITKKVGPPYLFLKNREMVYGAPPLGVARVVGSMAYGFAIKRPPSLISFPYKTNQSSMQSIED